MTKKTVLMGSGTLALAIAAVFAGKASAKFANATSLYVSTAGGCHAINATLSSSPAFTTVGTGLVQAKITTAAGVQTRKLWAVACTGASAKKVYFHP